jgi:hypothetical protein
MVGFIIASALSKANKIMVMTLTRTGAPVTGLAVEHQRPEHGADAPP